MGPETSTGGTQDPKMSKWDPGPQHIQVGPGNRDLQSGTQDPKIFKWNPGLSIFYSFNRLFYT